MSDNLFKHFKEKLASDQGVIGPFMKTGEPAFVEAAGYAGFDFAILDMEHGPVSFENMQNNIRAAIISRMIPIIRVEDKNESNIGKALDIGAMGIQVPQIENAEQAREVIKAAKFYPEGQRGVCRFVRAAQYSSMDRYDYFRTANDTLVILQLEGKEALENLEEILEVKGIDVIFIGPYDLSQSLGIPGQISHPDVIAQMQRIVASAKERNITVGTFIDKIENVELWRKAGVCYLSYSVDVGIFTEACKSIIEKA
jgi:4-hydroxy-2-oxoheptanedioate aldolase